jgi:hypothetical protein
MDWPLQGWTWISIFAHGCQYFTLAKGINTVIIKKNSKFLVRVGRASCLPVVDYSFRVVAFLPQRSRRCTRGLLGFGASCSKSGRTCTDIHRFRFSSYRSSIYFCPPAGPGRSLLAFQCPFYWKSRSLRWASKGFLQMPSVGLPAQRPSSSLPWLEFVTCNTWSTCLSSPCWHRTGGTSRSTSARLRRSSPLL